MTKTPRFITLLGGMFLVGIATLSAGCSDDSSDDGSAGKGSGGSGSGGSAGAGTGGSAGSGTGGGGTGGSAGSGSGGSTGGTDSGGSGGSTGGTDSSGGSGGSDGGAGGSSGGTGGTGGGDNVCPGSPSESMMCGETAYAGCMDDCGVANTGMRTCICVPGMNWDCDSCAITSGPFLTQPTAETCCPQDDDAMEDATDCTAENDGASCISLDDPDRICGCFNGEWDCASRPNEWTAPTTTCP